MKEKLREKVVKILTFPSERKNRNFVPNKLREEESKCQKNANRRSAVKSAQIGSFTHCFLKGLFVRRVCKQSWCRIFITKQQKGKFFDFTAYSYPFSTGLNFHPIFLWLQIRNTRERQREKVRSKVKVLAEEGKQQQKQWYSSEWHCEGVLKISQSKEKRESFIYTRQSEENTDLRDECSWGLFLNSYELVKILRIHREKLQKEDCHRTNRVTSRRPERNVVQR